MKVLIITDQRVYAEKGKYYTEYAFYCILNRYKDAFGDVTLFAKTAYSKSGSAVEMEKMPVLLSGSNLDVYLGKNKKVLKEIIPSFDLLVLRVPSVLANQAAKIAMQNNIPYLSEAMGCAWDQLWNHGLVGKLVAPYMFFAMKKTVKNATYASYVTKEFIQSRYPCRCEHLAASNVMIEPAGEEILSNRLRKIGETDFNQITIMTAGGVNVKYKGFQYVIGAIPILNQHGIKVTYYVVGNGDNFYLKEVACKNKVLDQVVFTGGLPHNQVLEYMDASDIYIQPSLQEGLPRTVIEAMSRACPALGARTAGIPELIPDYCVFKRKSSIAIANAILSIFNSEKMSELANLNYGEAQSYLNEKLQERRSEYYNKIKLDYKQGLKN